MVDRRPVSEPLPGEPSAAERRAVVALVALVLGLSLVPLGYGLATTPPDRVFLGLVGPYGNDQAFYLGWGARQAFDGHVVFEDKYNGADVRRNVVHPLWLLVGWTSRATGLPLLVANQLQRLVAGACALWLAWWHLRWLVRGAGWRLLALALVAFSSGFGIVAERFGLRTPDLWVVESNVFLSLLWETNLPAATALFLWAMLEGRRTFFEGERRALRTGLATLALGTVYPYAVVSVWFLLGLVGSVRVALGGPDFRRRRFRELVRDLAILVAVSGPIVAWDAFLVLTDPRLTVGQAHYSSPGPVAYAIGLGLVGLLAPVGAWSAWRRGDRRLLFPFLWAAGTAVQIYWPIELVPFQLQLILGVQLPLAALAVVALRDAGNAIAERFPRAAARRLALPAATLLVAGASVTNAAHYAALFAQIDRHRLPDSIDRTLHDALRHLDAASDAEEVVLAAPPVAPYVAVISTNRMVSADYEAPTADFHAKLRELEALADPAAGTADWTGFLRRHRVDWVLWEAEMEALLGPAARRRLEALPGVGRAWREGDVALYRVER